MSVLHHFGTLSKMSLLFSHQFTGIDLCLDSWSVSPPRWVLRDQVTHFIITETETNGRWNLCQINSGKPVSWGKKKNRVDFHLYFFNYRHSYVYGYATCINFLPSICSWPVSMFLLGDLFSLLYCKMSFYTL